MPTRYPEISMISTHDFFYPLVDDPYIQGRIACANVLSDMYAMAIPHIDNVLMTLAASTAMEPEDQHIVTKEMIRGFSDLATEAGTTVTGGQTVLNPWPIIGGVAMSACKPGDFIKPVHAVAGDVIVVTKPLGTQVAVNLFEWLGTDVKNKARWAKVAHVISEDAALAAYEKAFKSMSRLNRNGAMLMQKHGAHACTDVTGFGILGHAENLASNQEAAVTLELHTLPIIKDMKVVNEVVPFGLMDGRSAETSGGLLVCLSADKAQAFIDDIEKIDKESAWIIGRVVEGDRGARFTEDLKVIEV